MQRKKLAIIVSHPIQYYSPLFRMMAKEIDLVVFYGYRPGKKEIGGPGFDIAFQWDIDLLSGYEYHFFQNKSKTKQLSTFKGVKVSKKELEHVFKKHRITHCVIFGWLYQYYWQVYFYCLKNKIKLAVRGDSRLQQNQNIIKNAIKKIIYPQFIKKYTTVFYVGKQNREYMLYYGAKEKQMVFSPHAVDQEFWQSQNDKKNNDNVTLLWVGKFSKIKRPLDMLKAYEIIHKQHPEVTLTMIGTGELIDAVKKYQKDKNLTGVDFPGFKNQTELLPYYSKADVLVLTSQSETWGLVVNEAFSCLVPAIVSDNCGCQTDLIDEGKTGYTYQTGNVNDLVNAIERFLKDKENVHFNRYIKEKNKVYSFKKNIKAFKQFLKA